MRQEKIGVVIGASREAEHTIKKAREQGINVIALDGNPKAEGFLYADSFKVVDISDMEKVCEEIEKIRPDFVIPVPIGRYLVTTGYVNEKYHLKGIKYNETNLSTDKYLFHKKLQEKGLRNIKLCLVNQNTDIKEADMCFPAILKPRYGSGSRDVFYIEKEEQLGSAYETVQDMQEDFVLEQVVQGTEYGVDGAVIQGKLYVILVRKKINTPLPVRQAVSYLAVTKNEKNSELLEQIQQHLKQVVKTLGYSDCLFHSDLIVKNDKVFTIEISPRPSGHNLHNLFVPLATGIDMAEEYIKFLLNKEWRFETADVKCMQIRFFDFADVVIKKIPTVEELQQSGKCNIIKWVCNMKVGEYLGRIINGHSIMGRGFFVVEGNDEQDLLRQSEWILSQFKFKED